MRMGISRAALTALLNAVALPGRSIKSMADAIHESLRVSSKVSSGGHRGPWRCHRQKVKWTSPPNNDHFIHLSGIGKRECARRRRQAAR